MQSSMAVAGMDALSESCENILTRRANQRHYCIIAQFAKGPWPCPTTGASSAIAGKKSLPTIRSCIDSPQRRVASRVSAVNWVLRTGKKSGDRPSGGTGVGRPQGSATGESARAQLFGSKSSGAAGFQEQLDVLRWFNEVTMTDQANQIFRMRTGFSVSPEDHTGRIFQA